MNRNTATFFVFLIVLLFVAGCQRISRNFYVEVLRVHINIEEIGSDLYQISIYKQNETKGEDSVVIDYMISEMPSLTLSFPLDSSNDIHVIERYGVVRNIKSKKYNIVYPEMDQNNFKDRLRYKFWCDSVMFDIPSISIEIDPYLRSLSVWNEDSEYLGKLYPEK